MEIFNESIWVEVQQDSWTAFGVFKKKKEGVGVDGLMREEWGSIFYCKNSTYTLWFNYNIIWNLKKKFYSHQGMHVSIAT